MCTTYSFMIVYKEKGVGNFTVRDVAKKMWQHTGKITGGFFLYFVLIIIFGVSLGVLLGLMVGDSEVMAIILILLYVVAFLILGPNLLWQLSTSFLVIISDNEIPFTAFGRTRIVMKRNYWWTWIIVVSVSIIVLFISLMFALPLGIVTFIRTFTIARGGSEDTSIIYLVIFVFSSFFSTLTYSLIYIVCGFHYFSLAEKQDGTGLLERINEIGKKDLGLNNITI